MYYHLSLMTLRSKTLTNTILTFAWYIHTNCCNISLAECTGGHPREPPLGTLHGYKTV